MSKVLATYNIKGGVGKTSAAVNLAYLAAQAGHRTLLWDLDPQAASTFLFRVQPKVQGGGRGLIRLRTVVSEQIKGTDHEHLDLLPADFSYRHLDLALDSFNRPTSRLGRVLEPLQDEYDYIFLDCPPSISLVSESVFEAADALLVPVIPAVLSTQAFDQLAELTADGRAPVLAFFSIVKRRGRLHKRVMAAVRENHELTVLETTIPLSEDVEQMGEERNPVGVFAGRSRAGKAYEALWAEVEGHVQGQD
jgi:cellulose biosynthesis protein BcsQ